MLHLPESKDISLWIVTVVLSVLAKLLHSIRKELKGYKATEVKADLAFEEVSRREPKYREQYETWAKHREGLIR
jgi:hypothetical protein